MIASMVNESTNKAVEPDKQMVDEPIIANVEDFVLNMKKRDTLSFVRIPLILFHKVVL